MSENILNAVEKLLITKNYMEAKRVANEILMEDPENKEILVNLCEAHIFLDEYQEAEEITNKLLLENIDSPGAYFYKGVIFKYKNEFVKAKENYNLALAMGYDSKLVWRNLASLCELQRDTAGALTYLDLIITHYEKDTLSRIKKLSILMKNFMYTEALLMVNDLLFINPSNEDLYKFKALLLYAIGKKDEMADFCIESLSKFPQNIDLKRMLLINRSDSEDPEVILKEINELLVKNSNTGLSLLKGEMLLLLEKEEEAIPILKIVFAQDDGIFREEAGFHLMLLHTLKADYEIALDYVNSILAKNVNSMYILPVRYYKPMLLEKLKDSSYPGEYETLVDYFENKYEGNRYFILIYLALSYIGLNLVGKAKEIAGEMNLIHSDSGEVSFVRYLCAVKENNTQEINKYKELAGSKNPLISQVLSLVEA